MRLPRQKSSVHTAASPSTGTARTQLPRGNASSVLPQLCQEKLNVEVQNEACCQPNDAARNRTQDYVPGTARRCLVWLWVDFEKKHSYSPTIQLHRMLSSKYWTLLAESPLNFKYNYGRTVPSREEIVTTWNSCRQVILFTLQDPKEAQPYRW